METLDILNNEKVPSGDIKKFLRRKSVRAIVVDDDNKIAVLYSQNLNYYTLPGGCMETGENSEQAIVRECKEEVGCKVKIESVLGNVLEVRKEQLKISEVLGYFVKVVGKKSTPQLTNNEIKEDLVTRWVTPTNARKLFLDEIKYQKDSHKHIGRRSLAFINKAFPKN